MPEMPETLPARVAALEDRLDEAEAEVAALIMFASGLTERLNIQRVLIASLNAEAGRITENTELAYGRIEGALRVLAGYRGFSRSQKAVLRMLDTGAASDALTPSVLTEPLL